MKVFNDKVSYFFDTLTGRVGNAVNRYSRHQYQNHYGHYDGNPVYSNARRHDEDTVRICTTGQKGSKVKPHYTFFK